MLLHAQPDLIYSAALWCHISIFAILQMGELRAKDMVSPAQVIQLEATQLMLQLCYSGAKATISPLYCTIFKAFDYYS